MTMDERTMRKMWRSTAGLLGYEAREVLGVRTPASCPIDSRRQDRARRAAQAERARSMSPRTDGDGDLISWFADGHSTDAIAARTGLRLSDVQARLARCEIAIILVAIQPTSGAPRMNHLTSW